MFDIGHTVYLITHSKKHYKVKNVHHTGYIDIVAVDGSETLLNQNYHQYRRVGSKKENLSILVEPLGMEYRRNVEKAMALANIPYQVERGGREDIWVVYVETARLNEASIALNDYYKAL